MPLRVRLKALGGMAVCSFWQNPLGKRQNQNRETVFWPDMRRWWPLAPQFCHTLRPSSTQDGRLGTKGGAVLFVENPFQNRFAPTAILPEKSQVQSGTKGLDVGTALKAAPWEANQGGPGGGNQPSGPRTLPLLSRILLGQLFYF